MKKSRVALFLLLVLCLAFVASVAFAASPDDAEEAATVIDPLTGVSRWTYKDGSDVTTKTEGGYAAFESGTLYTTNPHGGYDSTTNKCKVCHAVHRAEGAYFLLRSDTQDDACSYCHIGGSAHSRKIVYDLAGSIYTPNGHTIGAAAFIPDSTVKQWTEDVVLTTYDAYGNPVTETVHVRRYYERRNRMFRFARHHGQNATSDWSSTQTPSSSSMRGAYGRIGPLALRCMNCHQPHNATDMIWKPYDQTYIDGGWSSQPLANGYKLLRSSPSGSIAGTEVVARPGAEIWKDGHEEIAATTYTADAAMVEIVGFPAAPANSGIPVRSVVRVPETTNIANFNGRLIWVKDNLVEAHDFYFNEQEYEDVDPSAINAYALSYWCADCHNLNIGYWQEAEMEFGFKSHSDRTHPAPYAGGHFGPSQCYSCHRNDLPLKGDAKTKNEPWNVFDTTLLPDGPTYGGSLNPNGCPQCHFGTGNYKASHLAAENAGYYAYYDFPHSGYSNTIKLLGPWTSYLQNYNMVVTTTANISSSNLDAVCKLCHPGIGVTH